MGKSKKSAAVLPASAVAPLMSVLQTRFSKNPGRHKGLNWEDVEARLKADPAKLWSLNEMENTGGEPDVIGLDNKSGEYLYCDCSADSPSGRRSVCYDQEGLESRKEHRPANSAMAMASEMGITLLDESGYRELQKLGKFDTKTSSWIATPDAVRDLGGAFFGDHRYGMVFIYHNGAQSYYAARGFRGLLRV